MCNCVNVEIGSHKANLVLKPWWKDECVSIDKCISEEIKMLWEHRIITAGCCCGHNKLNGFINVEPEYHYKMIELGYEYWINEFGVYCYKPKTV